MNQLEVATAAWLVGDRWAWGRRYSPRWATNRSAAYRADQGARVGQMFWVEVELDLDDHLTSSQRFHKAMRLMAERGIELQYITNAESMRIPGVAPQAFRYAR